MAKVIALLALSVAYASAASVTLTAANFESEVVTSGKNAFIKFQAPWFVHQNLIFFPRCHVRRVRDEESVTCSETRRSQALAIVCCKGQRRGDASSERLHLYRCRGVGMCIIRAFAFFFRLYFPRCPLSLLVSRNLNYLHCPLFPVKIVQVRTLQVHEASLGRPRYGVRGKEHALATF